MKLLAIPFTLLICSAFLWSSCRTERALWIDVRESGGRTTIAVTEGIARRLLDASEGKLSFTKKKNELLTRQMLRDVLDGRERAVTARDERGTEITVSTKPLSIPGQDRGKNRLVLDIYKSGEQTFHLTLPDLAIELGDEEKKISLHADVDWKSWLPFLAKAGGAVYIKNYDEDTELWVYVE